jgi:hypothetical protein
MDGVWMEARGLAFCMLSLCGLRMARAGLEEARSSVAAW